MYFFSLPLFSKAKIVYNRQNILEVLSFEYTVVSRPHDQNEENDCK
jgi:hypothetical protein